MFGCVAVLLGLVVLWGFQAQRAEEREALEARGMAGKLREDPAYIEREMVVTAYTAGPESTGKRPGHPAYGITASGVRARRGIVAADPAVPFGTRVWVEGYGHGVVADRGGAIRGNRLDVFVEDVEQARRWGVRVARVKFYYSEGGDEAWLEATGSGGLR